MASQQSCLRVASIITALGQLLSGPGLLAPILCIAVYAHPAVLVHALELLQCKRSFACHHSLAWLSPTWAAGIEQWASALASKVLPGRWLLHLPLQARAADCGLLAITCGQLRSLTFPNLPLPQA